MDIKLANMLHPHKVYTFKLYSGEEIMTKVLTYLETDSVFIDITEPVSLARTPQGPKLVPTTFTSDSSGKFMLNTNTIGMVMNTDASLQAEYIETLTGIEVPPPKKLILG